jgi:phosphomannomutase
MLIESLSGVRGYDQELDQNFVQAYAAAFCEMLQASQIVIGRDTRASGERIRNDLITVLSNRGNNVIDLGICPTPTVQYAVEHLNADGGIVVTASHNPLPWNGLKFIGSDGLFLDKVEMLELQNRRKTFDSDAIISWKTGELRVYSKGIKDHLQLVLGLPYINPSQITRCHFKVVVDAVNGAAFQAIPDLLEHLGCTVIRINCDASKPFPRTPEPLPENLTELCQTVQTQQADLGLAIDPDGDRLAIVSDLGRPISEEYTLVLAGLLVLSKSVRLDKKIVCNLSTTMAVDDIASKYGAEVIRTAIGEINVAKTMREVNALIGGEGNGGVILPEAHLGRDSLVATVLVLQLLTELQKPLSKIMLNLPAYVMVKQKVPRGSIVLAQVVADLQQILQPEQLNTIDGYKFIWKDHWVHLRPSNTEPVIRIYAEALNQETANQVIAPFLEYFQQNT